MEHALVGLYKRMSCYYGVTIHIPEELKPFMTPEYVREQIVTSVARPQKRLVTLKTLESKLFRRISK